MRSTGSFGRSSPLSCPIAIGRTMLILRHLRPLLVSSWQALNPGRKEGCRVLYMNSHRHLPGVYRTSSLRPALLNISDLHLEILAQQATLG